MRDKHVDAEVQGLYDQNDELRTAKHKAEAECREALAKVDKLQWFIGSEGYRRCDIPACNCGSFHGGNAYQRLSEVGDALGELTQGSTILAAVEVLVAAREARKEGEG